MGVSAGFGKRALVNSTLLAISGLVGLTVVETALKLAHFPAERGIQITHPPNYRKSVSHLEFEYEFRTNSLGLRGPEIALHKPPGTVRIFVAGDSFVEGIGVDGDSTLPAYLEKALQPAVGHTLEVINGGLTGTGVFERGRLFRHLAVELNPDMLIHVLFDNDVSDARRGQTPEAMSEALPEQRGLAKTVLHGLWPRIYTVASESWSRFEQASTGADLIETMTAEARARGVPEPRIAEWNANVLPVFGDAIREGTIAPQIFSLSLVSPGYWSDPIDLERPAIVERFGIMTTLLTADIEYARQLGIEVAVVYIPSKFQFDPRSHERTDPWVLAGAAVEKRWLSEQTPIRQRLAEWAQANEVRFLDMTPRYREAVRQGAALTWQLDEHLNAAGNDFTARVIAEWLLADDAVEALRQ